MSNYTFETITTAQALSFDTNFDTLVFTGPGSTASGIQVAYDAKGSTGDLAITSQGRTVVFGGGFRNEDHITFADGSAVSIGGTVRAPPLAGGPENDALFLGVVGGFEDGGAGADTLVANNQGAGLTGGPGADLFIIYNLPTGFPMSLGTTAIEDWQAGDRLSFGPMVATAANYSEIALGPNASEADAVAAAANGLIGSGAADVVAVQVPFGVFVFADTNNDNGVADSRVLLQTTVAAGPITLSSIDFSQIVATPAQPAFGAVPFILAPPAPAGSGASGTISGNMNAAQLHDLNPAIIDVASPTEFRADGDGGLLIDVVGHGFTYNSGLIDSGRIDHITFVDVVGGTTNLTLSLTEPDIDAQQLTLALVADNILMAYGQLLGGNDTLTGGPGADLINGGGGDDLITGGGGTDTLQGDAGHDTLTGGPAADHLNGGTASDLLIGGGGADVFEFAVNDSTWVPAVQIVSVNDFDHIADWTSSDVLQFFSGPAVTSGAYAEITVATALEASSIANSNSGHGIDYTVAQVGLDVIVFAPAQQDAIVLVNRTLADISSSNIVVSAGNPISPPPPPVSPPPTGQVIVGAPGGDTIQAPDTNDTITAGSGGANYIRGNGGDDVIHGGAAFDDINGNKGNDTIEGGSGGGDWLVGGQGNDFITAHAGDGLLYGNLGSDTLIGSNGADVMLGGQADNSIQGGAGNDYISGDRGNDTETGGAGADTFHSFSGAGIDKVLDFNLAEGDRVLLDPGTNFTVHQVGADTVVDLNNGDQVILVGINMTTLTGNWIVVGF